MNFELLVPLGLLGLIGILVLILIYIIKPNYQNKSVTSTYIWRLSLKRKKKRIPINKLRNIILFICQLLVVTSMALILASPSLVDRSMTDDTDVIYILDASASMHAETEGETRFDIAVEDVYDRVNTLLSSDGRATVIVADGDPYFLARRVDSSRRMRLLNDLNELAERGASYTVADVDASFELAKEVLTENPNAQLVFFTDTEYAYLPDRVDVQVVRGESDWNAAILDASAVLADGYYTLTVKVACYGISQELEVSVLVEGANDSDRQISFYEMVDCSGDSVKTVVFRVGGGQEADDLYYRDLLDGEKFYSFESIRIGIEADDCYDVDNVFYVFGGQKQRIRVEYFSGGKEGPNPFIQSALAWAGEKLSEDNNFELDVTEIKWGDAPILEGFDLYIFEHEMPARLPTDGAIILLDPSPAYDKSKGEVGKQAGFTVSQVYRLGESVSLAEGDDYEGHPVTRFVVADEIEVTEYDLISEYDDEYEVLLSYDGHPLYMVRNDAENKIAVMSFSVHKSNLSKIPENFLLMYSLIDYFYPTILRGSAYEVGEEFTLNTWGSEITLAEKNETFFAEELPQKYSIDVPGSYHFRQTTYYGSEMTVGFFVRTPAAESNILKMEDTLSNPYEGLDSNFFYRDLLTIFAAILVGLLFVEWTLHSCENR